MNKAVAVCPKCHGTDYVQSEVKHENGRQPHAWAAICECRILKLNYFESESQNESSCRSESG